MAFSSQGLVHRPTVTGTRGMVASAHPLSSLAGARILLDGGNATDAAVAVAAALNVVEPYMSGMAGVGYALVYSAQEDRVRVLDYCGHTPYDADSGAFTSNAEKDRGPRSCLVPGACGGWLQLLETYGSLDRATVFGPAIELADQGYAATVCNARFMGDNGGRLYPNGAHVIMPRGRAPLPGEVVKQPELARSFRRVVEGGAERFYRGDIAEEMVEAVQTAGGWLSLKDLADFKPDWGDPISTIYRGYQVLCPPPPSAGFQILQTLNILEGYQLEEIGYHSELGLHLFLEAVKLANADRLEYAADPGAPIAGLLSKGYASHRRGLISEKAAVHRGDYYPPSPLPGQVEPGQPGDWLNECTTHFDVVDAQGNAVAVTQSLGSGFGAGMTLGQTGMFLNNFIRWGDLVRGCPNEIGPHKKLDMCLAPLQVFRKGRFFSALGTPGSWGIQQTSVQFLTNVLDYGMNIQAAIEAPRFRMEPPGLRVPIENRVSPVVLDGLGRRGHQIQALPAWSATVGGAQGIVREDATGAMMGGADPRRDGYVIGL